MNDNHYEEEETNIEALEVTKELNDLENLQNNMETPDSTEMLEDMEYQTDFDENMEDSELIFKTKLETKEEIQKEQKESLKQKIQKKWASLSKKEKTLWICGGIFLLVLIILLIVFLVMVFSPKQNEPVLPDVILEMDNYRYENGTLVFLDDEEELGRYECQNKEENLCKTKEILYDEKIDTVRRVDEDGKPVSIHSKIYYDRFVFLQDSKEEKSVETILYDIKENKIVDTIFDVLAYSNYDDYFVVKNKEGNYSLKKIEEEEIKTILDYSSGYEEIHVLSSGDTPTRISVKKDSSSYVTDMENHVLSKALNSLPVGATEKYLKTKDASDHYHIYDYNGKEILKEKQLSYVDLLNDLILAVIENQIMFFDYEENIMSMDKFEVKNTNYNPVETVKNGKIVKKSLSFETSITGHIVNIDIYNNEEKENHTFDLYDGKLSKNLAMINYFNGTIYFYSDEEKTNPVGSYNCTNKNQVDETTTALNVCKPAMDSVLREKTGNLKERSDFAGGVIPMFLKQFVFIQDGDAIKLMNILPSGSEIASYEEVDTSSYTGANDITLSQNSSVQYIAKSKSSGKFGVAKIESGDVKPIIPFNKESIVILGENYVVKENGSYSLYNKSGQKISDDRAGRIVDYHDDYVKTLSDDTYFVYPMKGDIIDQNGYQYIELYDEYYAVVSPAGSQDLNKYRLHVYRYDDEKEKKTEILTDGETPGVGLEIDNYYDNYGQILAFELKFKQNTIEVKIGMKYGEYKTKEYPIQKESSTPTVPSVTAPSGSEEGEENDES